MKQEKTGAESSDPRGHRLPLAKKKKQVSPFSLPEVIVKG